MEVSDPQALRLQPVFPSVKSVKSVVNFFSFARVVRMLYGVKAMQIEYPESEAALAGSSPERFENEARRALAMKWCER